MQDQYSKFVYPMASTNRMIQKEQTITRQKLVNAFLFVTIFKAQVSFNIVRTIQLGGLLDFVQVLSSLYKKQALALKPILNPKRTSTRVIQDMFRMVLKINSY